MDKRFCKQFSASSPCLPRQQGSCSKTVELSENILQNLLSPSTMARTRLPIQRCHPRPPRREPRRAAGGCGDCGVAVGGGGGAGGPGGCRVHPAWLFRTQVITDNFTISLIHFFINALIHCTSTPSGGAVIRCVKSHSNVGHFLLFDEATFSCFEFSSKLCFRIQIEQHRDVVFMFGAGLWGLSCHGAT